LPLNQTTLGNTEGRCQNLEIRQGNIVSYLNYSLEELFFRNWLFTWSHKRFSFWGFIFSHWK